MTALTDSHIFVGNSSNVATDVAMSGDVTISDTGATTIKTGVNLAGNPTTTTQTAGDISSRIATTAFVNVAISGCASSLLSSGSILIGNALSQATPQSVSGDIQLGFTGIASIQTGAVTAVKLSANLKIEDFGITIDGGGLAPATGSRGYITIPYSGTITAWYLAANVVGSCVIDIKRSGTSIIGTGNKPTLSSAKSGNATVSGWTSTAITAGDIIEFNLNSISTITWVNLVVKLNRT